MAQTRRNKRREQADAEASLQGAGAATATEQDAAAATELATAADAATNGDAGADAPTVADAGASGSAGTDAETDADGDGIADARERRLDDEEQLAIAGAGTLLIGVLYLVLPEKLTVGPSWALLAVSAVLIAPLLFSAYVLNRRLPMAVTRGLALALLAVVTLAEIGSVVLLIYHLPSLKTAALLLKPAALLWVMNILVFGTWYWEMDGGGPYKRQKGGYETADFLFPQQMMDRNSVWHPLYFDYVYVAFGFATAFSPTDTPPLGRNTKLLSMVEAIISLLVVALLIGRSVNIIG